MEVEPLADDLGSLGPDINASEAGWLRRAPYPLFLPR
jgi:formate dehydrogenase maturation protein FdhE